MAYIKGISYYLPEKVVTNEELIKEFPEWSVDKVAKKVGVYSRHIAGKNETAGDMAEKAALRLFDEYKISPSEIDFVLLCTVFHRRIFALCIVVCSIWLGSRSGERCFAIHHTGHDDNHRRIVCGNGLYRESQWATCILELYDSIHIANRDDD